MNHVATVKSKIMKNTIRTELTVVCTFSYVAW